MDNKQKYHEILLRNQQWKYSAPHLSDEYWDDLDEDEAAATAADSFLTQIKQRTEEMRYGTVDGEISIEAPIIYNEEFLPHWKEFANALAQHQYCLKCLPKDTETKLVLCDMDLPDTVLDLLSKAFESTHFTRFALRDNNLGQRGIDFALKYLKSNQIMKRFALVDNPCICFLSHISRLPLPSLLVTEFAMNFLSSNLSPPSSKNEGDLSNPVSSSMDQSMCRLFCLRKLRFA